MGTAVPLVWTPTETTEDPTTTVAAPGILIGDDEVTVTDTASMPPVGYVGWAVIDDEVITVTGAADNPYTIERAQAGTVEADHAAGAAFNWTVVPATVIALVKEQVTKADLGLGLVDNTSDANKPVSTAQSAINSGFSAALALMITDPGGSDDDVLQRKSGSWAFRTLAQLWTDLTSVARTFTGSITFTGTISSQNTARFLKGFGRGGFRCDASNEIELTLDAAVTTTGQTAWTIDSASVTALAAVNLPATCRTPSGEKVIARTLVGTTLTVVRARFGTAASTYANGSTFSTHLDEDYLASSSGPSTLLLANKSADGNFYLPPRTTASGITPPADGQEFTFVDVTGTAGRLLGGAVLTIRSYQASGTGPEWGNIDHPNGSITLRYNAADLTYSVIARNGVPEIMDGDSLTALGPLRWYTGTGDPNGVFDPFGERAVYLDKSGGAGTTLWVNEDGTVTGWVAK